MAEGRSGNGEKPAGDPRATLRSARSTSSLPSAEGFPDAGHGGAAEPAPSLPGYEILEELAHGATGIVFRARQANLERDVAVKSALQQDKDDPTRRMRFLSEAVVTGSLDHPNVVPTHDLIFDEEGRPSLSMKLIGGVTWEELLHPRTEEQRRQAAACDLDRHLEILLAVCNAVAFAHSRGILHRDLKPANVMIGEYGEVLVMDWGLAVALPGATAERTRSWRGPRPSEAGGPEGTPAYMAPEMATGRSDLLAPATDVYLLGAILFEVVTGRPPHLADSVPEALQAAASAEVPAFPPGVPRELREICLRAMAAEPRDRFADAAEFQRALRHFTTHRQSLAIADAATECLESARERALAGTRPADLYADLSEATSAFRQALLLWGDNPRARTGLDDARLTHAGLALDGGDLGLASTLLDGMAGDAVAVLQGRVVTARAQRDRALRRATTLRRSLLAIVVAVLAVSFSALFLLAAMRDAGDEIADQMGELLTSDALASMQRAVEAGARDLDRIRSRSELALYAYAREIERQLAAPSPPLGITAEEAAAEPRPSFFAPPGGDPERIRAETARLDGVLPTLRWLFGPRNPSIARFFAALADSRLYTQYPGGDLPRGYDPTRRAWFRLGLGLAGAEVATTSVYQDASTGRWVVSSVTPLRAAGRTVGVAGVDFDLAAVLASRRPTEAWATRVVVSVLRVDAPAPELHITAVLGEAPGAAARAGTASPAADLSQGDPDLAGTFAEVLHKHSSGVVRTEDARGDWLWAFAPLAGPTRSDGERAFFLTMAAPTEAVTGFADETRERIRAESREQLRRALGHAAIGLALALIAIACVTLLGRRRE